VVKRDDVLELVGRMKALNFEPRTDFAYSNTNYTLAALIVERVSGRSLAEFAREKIFLPLGMLHTRFAETHGLIVHNRAYGYREVADHSFELRMPNYDLAGPTNLLTTVEDLARWDRNFDDKAVGGDAALLEMQTPATLSNGKPAVMLTDLGENANYALGLTLLKYKGLNVVEHNGRDAGYRADLIRFPDQHFAVACLCNLALPPDNLPSVLARRVADVYLADQLVSVPHARAEFHTASVRQRPRANVMAADLAEYTGRYYSDEINTTYNVELKDSSLSITRPKYGTRLLHSDPESRDVFTMSDFSVPFPSVTVTFKRDAHGHVTKFLMDEDGSGILNFQFTKSR
jgi:CubicO group peptidase (beta-lactamase class C family)